MGFPMGCSELAVPKLLVYIIIALASLRRLLIWVFTALGLADLLDTADDVVPLPVLRRHRPRPMSAARIQEALPAEPYREPEGSVWCERESCAVCLYEFEEGEEVRRLCECCHVFHSRCLDPWVELGQSTCPLCRSPLIADEFSTEPSPEYDHSELYYDGEGDFDLFPLENDGSLFLPPFSRPEELLLSASLEFR